MEATFHLPNFRKTPKYLGGVRSELGDCSNGDDIYVERGCNHCQKTGQN